MKRHPAFVEDRRQFLLGAASVGVMVMAGCTNSGPGSAAPPAATNPDGTPASLSPLTRPTVKLPHGAFGFPSPFAANGGFGYIQMSLLYDTLLWKDGSGTLLPWLASGFDRSADDLTYTFKLRPDLKWNDGKPLTAEDVTFTFEYYAALPALPPPVIVQPPAGVASVRATSPDTIEITLESPNVTFAEEICGALPIIPRHVWSDVSDPAADQKTNVLIGSGPYRLDSYNGDGGALLYVAIDDYFLGAPFVKRVEFHEVDDEFAALLAGAIDVATGDGVRPDVIRQFERDASYSMITEQGATASVLYWNLSKGGALADVVFRRACATAIDRQDLVDRLASGNGKPGNPGFLGSANPFRTEVEHYSFDPRAANAMLDAAGYTRTGSETRTAPDGSQLSFDLLFSNTDSPLAELLKSALERIGVNIKPQPVQIGPALFGGKLSGGYEMAVLPYPGPSGGGLNSDPDLLRRLFSSNVPPSLTSATGYANAKFDKLANRQRRTFDEPMRRNLVTQMQHILAAELPVLSLYEPDSLLIFRKSSLDRWYLTPGQFPTANDNKQLLVTGLESGTDIRPAK